MYKLIPLTAALVLAASLPQAALAQHGRDDDDRGKNDRGDDRGQDNRGHRGDDDDNRGGDRRDNDNGRGHGDDRRVESAVREAVRNGDIRIPDARRIENRIDRSIERQVEREIKRRGIPVTRDGQVVLLRRDRDRGLIAGCPPGLAKRDNGCLPPGQERRIARARYDYLWGARDAGTDYRYDNGYLYRMSPQGSLLGYLPVLGGALAPGNTWPGQYSYQAVPAYQMNYFGLNDRYDYRYADGTVYGLDRTSGTISQVAALLTGQQWNVGQPAPGGYDVYNVPYAWRDQYPDTADSRYRYSDGYVYQVDPTTQLVQAVIQLLT